MKPSLLSGRVADGAFSPDDIANLEAWYDASDTGTITESSGNITQWDDKSGNGRHLDNVVGTPRTGDSTQNSLNAIDFLANERLYRVTGVGGDDDPICGNDCTVVAAFKSASSGLGTFQAPACTLTDSSSGGRPFDRWSSTSAHRVTITSSAALSFGNLRSETSPFTWILTIEKDTPATNTQRVTEYFDATQTHTVDVTSTAYVVSNQHIVVGERMDTVVDFVGQIYEIVIYDAVLGSSDLSDLRTYLGDKWGY